MSPVLDLQFLKSPAGRKRIAVAVLAAAAVGAAYGLLAPRWYRSVLTLVPAKQQKGGFASLLGGDLGGLAANLDVGGPADGQRIAAVLQSIAVTDAVIDHFDLKERYGEKIREQAREAVWRHCEIKILPKPNLVQLSCEDKDPKFVQQLLEYFATVGNEVFQRVNVGAASEEVRVMEKRVAELRVQADEAATRMRDFQERNKIVDLDSQAKAFVASVAALESERISRQMELGWARRYSSPDEASALRLQSQIAVVDDQLRDLEMPAGGVPSTSSPAPGAGRKGKGLFPAALEVPALRAEYEKLFRDRKVAEATLIFALDRLESARASRARDVSTFQILDPPTVPTRKSRPRGLEALLTGAAVGLLGGVAYEAWRQRGRNRSPTAAP